MRQKVSTFGQLSVAGGCAPRPPCAAAFDTASRRHPPPAFVHRRWTSQSGLGWYDWLSTFIPFFGWIRTYPVRKYLLPDIAVRPGPWGPASPGSASIEAGGSRQRACTAREGREACTVLYCMPWALLGGRPRPDQPLHALPQPLAPRPGFGPSTRHCIVMILVSPQLTHWLLQAGLSVAAMVVPQGMSYSQNLAFLPQVYGLVSKRRSSPAPLHARPLRTDCAPVLKWLSQGCRAAAAAPVGNRLSACPPFCRFPTRLPACSTAPSHPASFMLFWDPRASW